MGNRYFFGVGSRKIPFRAAFVFCISALSASAQDKAMGLTLSDDSRYRSIPLAAMPLNGELPKRIDLRDLLPPPGDQGNQSSCVGWATAYALKSYQERTERGQEGGQDMTFSPAYVYNQINSTHDCSAGTDIIDALNLLRSGAAPMSEFPYDPDNCSLQPDSNVRNSAQQFGISDWRTVNVQDPLEVKAQVASGFPVVIGMLVDDAFQNLGNEVYQAYSGNALGAHAMLVIGYDDDYNAFEVINSWGSGWGSGGYGWIAYDAFRNAVRQGFVAQDIVVKRNPPVPSPPPPPSPPPQGGVDGHLNQIHLVHNIQMSGFAGPALGMQISPFGDVAGASGKNVVIETKFFFSFGNMVLANPAESFYRNASGQVATSVTFVADSNYVDLAGVQLYIPYFALNFAPSGGFNYYQLSAVVSIFVDGEEIAQSQPQPFTFQW